MKTSIEIINWIQKRPYWEQYAFSKILNGETITDEDYKFLLGCVLEDNKIGEKKLKRPEPAFAKANPETKDPAERDPQSRPFKVVSISNIKNVNALAPGHVMEFNTDPNTITAIYGGNGSGKSGFARILSSAGFSRGDRKVLANQTGKVEGDGSPSATIALANGTVKKSINHICGQSCPELDSFYVFDSASVTVHLTQKNTLCFSPGGLSALSDLADFVIALSSKLKERIQAAEIENNFVPLFQGESQIATLVSLLSDKTNLDRLRDLATLSKEDEDDREKLNIQINALKSLDIPEKVKENSAYIAQIDQLATKLNLLISSQSQEEYDSISNLLSDLTKWQEIAKTSGAEQFESLNIEGIGGEIWQAFLKAARNLAEIQHPSEEMYPHEEDRCLLCNQKLPSQSVVLIHRFWSYLKAEAQTKLKTIESALKVKRSKISSNTYVPLDEDTKLYGYLESSYPELLSAIREYAEQMKGVGKSILDAIDKKDRLTKREILKPSWPFEEIKNKINTDTEELKKRDPSVELFDLENRLREYEHRALLARHLKGIEALVDKMSMVAKAESINLNTRAISAEQNKLFTKLVTDKYKAIFEQKLASFGRPLKVQVTTGSQKGRIVKEITLVGGSKASPDRVLSEGEKKVVALADFFTEVELDEDNGGILLDDPVNSLDSKWKASIADEIVYQTTLRQVIVMTHDLAFLYLLSKRAEKKRVQLQCHWIKRGDFDDIPGYVYLNNSPTLEKEYRSSKIAHEIYSRALNAAPQEQEALLEQGFGALRASYEVMIIHDLFNDVVQRFEERISFGRLSEVVSTKSICAEIIEKSELCSRYIGGHSHSDAYGEKPTPKLLLSEIEYFNNLKNRIKKIKADKEDPGAATAEIIPVMPKKETAEPDENSSVLMKRVSVMRDGDEPSKSQPPDSFKNPN